MTGRSPYLLALYLAERRRTPPVPVGAVESVDRPPTAVTEAFRQLDDMGLVVYEPDDSATLTGSGRDAAEPLHATYMTLCWLFRSVLDRDISEGEAVELTGVVSPEVADRLELAFPDEAKRAVRADDPGGT